MLRGLLRGAQEKSEEGAEVLHRGGLSLHGNGMETPLEGLPYGDTHSTYPNQTFSDRLPV